MTHSNLPATRLSPCGGIDPVSSLFVFTLLLAFAGFACVDALNVLNLGTSTAIVYTSRLERRSALPGGLSFVVGLYSALLAFGVGTVVGVRYLVGPEAISSSARYWAQLVIGIVLIAVASLTWFSNPGTPKVIRTIAERYPWLLVLVGLTLGCAEAATSAPYLSALAMLASHRPLPSGWVLMLMGYCLIAVAPSTFILVLSTRRTPGARRAQRTLVRTVSRYGPTAIRVIFLFLGTLFIANALAHASAL